MFRLFAEKDGETIELTRNPAYTITSIDGLTPPDATINSDYVVGLDGTQYNSSHVEDRQIIITMAISSSAGANRNNLYRFFRSGKLIRIHFRSDLRDVYIDGYVQNAYVGIFDQKQMAQITIKCPDPYFYGLQTMTASSGGTEALFEFPFSIQDPIPFSKLGVTGEIIIDNPSPTENGMVIIMTASGAVTSPCVTQIETGDYIEIATTLQDGDIVEIDTRDGQRNITRIRSGVRSSLLMSRDLGSTWINAVSGRNTLVLTAGEGSGDLSGTVYFSPKYEGV